MKLQSALLLSLVAVAGICPAARGEERIASTVSSATNWNLAAPTSGGRQFWADELVRGDWRIQRNVMTGHYRLLDDHDVRKAWGSFDACRTKFDQLSAEEDLPPLRGKVVVVLHGLFRSRHAMAGLGEYLEEEGGYTVVNVGYPSTRADLTAHAASLQRVIDNLEGAEEINFVAHSLGNLVIRRYLASQTDDEAGLKPDPRIKRIVMLGPPNRGAQIARWAEHLPGFRLVVQGPGEELTQETDNYAKHLATPACEFGILAGGDARGHERNPLVKGNDDLVVSVEETKLPGAHDFAVLPVTHTYMMDNKVVREYTLHFLQSGCFVSEDTRQPLKR